MAAICCHFFRGRLCLDFVNKFVNIPTHTEFLGTGTIYLTTKLRVLHCTAASKIHLVMFLPSFIYFLFL